MPIALPALRSSTQQVLYGFTRIVSCMTRVTQFNNATEQRWVHRPPLYHFILPMSSLSDQDRAAWMSFFIDPEVKGKHGSTATITLNGVTYANLSLDSDILTTIARRQMVYDIQEVRLHQVKPASFTYTPPVVGADYPTFKFGQAAPTSFRAELPYTQFGRFRTSISTTPFGQQFSFPWYASAVPSFPTTSLRAWTLDYPLLTDEDLITLETFFLGKQGRYSTFTFTDMLDENTVYSNVRFASDDLSIRYVGPNHNAVTVRLVQIHT